MTKEQLVEAHRAMIRRMGDGFPELGGEGRPKIEERWGGEPGRHERLVLVSDLGHGISVTTGWKNDPKERIVHRVHAGGRMMPGEATATEDGAWPVSWSGAIAGYLRTRDGSGRRMSHQLR